jgi:2,3-bisphosphoglycerate-dependent phosphoglycerate mutase
LTARLVLLRHGQSVWNRDNRFTGWTDVELTEEGVSEARRAGILLKRAGIPFDIAFTSMLKRAIRTLWVVLAEIEMEWLPVQVNWRLNERHYGALQGLNKAEMAAQLSQETVFELRRSFDAVPPPLALDDARHPRFDRRYAHVDPGLLPAAESLEDTLERVMPCWEAEIRPRLMAGEQVLVVAHGNSLRAMVKYLDGISEVDVPDIYLPTGIPLVYSFDSKMQLIHKDYLGNPKIVEAAIETGRLPRPERKSHSGNEFT